MNKQGCGLGLTICKKIVEKLGGDIQMISHFGVGTKVAFSVAQKKFQIVGETNEMEESKHNCSSLNSTFNPHMLRLKSTISDSGTQYFDNMLFKNETKRSESVYDTTQFEFSEDPIVEKVKVSSLKSIIFH
jgi:hypothetical protein